MNSQELRAKYEDHEKLEHAVKARLKELQEEVESTREYMNTLMIRGDRIFREYHAAVRAEVEEENAE